MDALIIQRGDDAAGIEETQIKIEGLPDPIDEDDRCEIREDLQYCFSTILGGSIVVRFDDECVVCGLRGSKHHPGCPEL